VFLFLVDSYSSSSSHRLLPAGARSISVDDSAEAEIATATGAIVVLAPDPTYTTPAIAIKVTKLVDALRNSGHRVWVESRQRALSMSAAPSTAVLANTTASAAVTAITASAMAVAATLSISGLANAKIERRMAAIVANAAIVVGCLTPE
jgi:hypothetical protein